MSFFFRQSIFNTECDRCGLPFTLNKGGVCTECRQILCGPHLHGSPTQRMRTSLFGRPALCVRCRAGETPAAVRRRNGQ